MSHDMKDFLIFKKTVLKAIAASAAGEPAEKEWGRVAKLAEGGGHPPKYFKKIFAEEINNFRAYRRFY